MDGVLFCLLADIEDGLIIYTLSEGVTDTDDSFEFSVMDSKPNTVSGLTFNIRWSYVEFGMMNISATEEQQIIEIPVMRRGSTSGVSLRALDQGQTENIVCVFVHVVAIRILF